MKGAVFIWLTATRPVASCPAPSPLVLLNHGFCAGDCGPGVEELGSGLPVLVVGHDVLATVPALARREEADLAVQVTAPDVGRYGEAVRRVRIRRPVRDRC